MIEQKKNGYLAKVFDTIDLANGISWVVHNSQYSELALNARKKVIQEFDSKKTGLINKKIYGTIFFT